MSFFFLSSSSRFGDCFVEVAVGRVCGGVELGVVDGVADAGCGGLREEDDDGLSLTLSVEATFSIFFDFMVI